MGDIFGYRKRRRVIPYASLPSMQAWATRMMRRAPDFIIGDNYLRRWWIVPRNEWCNVYLHEILQSDDDRALHDHPWANRSFLISGSYMWNFGERSMLSVLVIAGGLWLIGLAAFAVAAPTAPYGFQDERGFHQTSRSGHPAGQAAPGSEVTVAGGDL